MDLIEVGTFDKKRSKKRLKEQKWTEIMAKLNNGICPQCNKKRDSLDLVEIDLDCVLDDDPQLINIIACKKCQKNISSAQDEALIKYKDMALEMRNIEIELLKLKLGDEEASSSTDGEYSSDEERGRSKV